MFNQKYCCTGPSIISLVYDIACVISQIQDFLISEIDHHIPLGNLNHKLDVIPISWYPYKLLKQTLQYVKQTK